MRIIAGSLRSLPLKTPKGLNTRPTTDRIKETLFNMIHSDLPGTCFLDLFSGSGAIGLEAVSRGAKMSIMVEKDREAISCIEDNIRFTKTEDKCKLIKTDVISALRRLEGSYVFDYVFMDPPYGKLLEKDVISYLSKSSLINSDSTIIVEADLDTDFEYLKDLGFYELRYKKYKTNAHIFIKREN